MSGTLYIVATPIGNLEDITLRAVRIISGVDIILAEDTRVTLKLLEYVSSLQLSFKNEKPLGKAELISYHQHSPESRMLEIWGYLSQGKNIALVTDAGTPGVSDPGNELIEFLLEHDPEIKIVPVPGASAITAALSVSGFPVNKFVFLGFMPKKKRSKLFEWLKKGEMTFSFFDSPHRVIKNLNDIRDIFGNETKVTVARELTKIYETLYRGNIQNVIDKLEKTPLKGEIVVVVGK